MSSRIGLVCEEGEGRMSVARFQPTAAPSKSRSSGESLHIRNKE